MVGIGAGVPLAAFVGAARAQLRRVTIGANPAGTNFNVIGGAFAQLIQRSLRVPSIVRPYAGSSVYMPMLERGELTLGINSGIDAFLAFRGEPPYPSPMRNIRALLAIYPLGYMYWARASTPIESITDLRGRRVVVNYRSLVPLNRLNRAVLATGGLTEDDVDAVTAAGLPQGARLVAEGRADAVAMGYRLPLVRQMDASIPGGLRFLRLGPDEAKIAEMMPGAWVDTIDPGQTTVGIEEPIRSAVYDTFLATGVHIDEDDAFRLVELLHGAWDDLRREYALLAGVGRGDLVPSNHAMPYHDGAVAYFRDAGLWTDAHARRQEELLGR